MIDSTEKIMMIDTETTNSLDDPICYDVGYRVFDLNNNIYEEASLVNADVFLDKELMSCAYFADKIPDYWRDIWEHKRILLPWHKIKWKVFDACKQHNCRIIAAHNARFDNRSLNLTQRYLTSSRYRYFLPYGVEWHDTLKMCREIFKNDDEYKIWCKTHGFMTGNNQPQMTAEVVYKYITNNLDFTEHHTGLEDTRIESDIFIYCVKRNPEINGKLWDK